MDGVALEIVKALSDDFNACSTDIKLLSARVDEILRRLEIASEERVKIISRIDLVNGTVRSNQQIIAMIVQWKEDHAREHEHVDSALKEASDKANEAHKRANLLSGLNATLTTVIGGLLAFLRK